MPVIVKLPFRNWSAQVRRKGRYIINTFRRRQDADEWAPETEHDIATPGALGRGSTLHRRRDREAQPIGESKKWLRAHARR